MAHAKAPSVTSIAGRIMKERAAAGAPISREESFALAYPIFCAEDSAYRAQRMATMTADGTLDAQRELASQPAMPDIRRIIATERERHMRAGLTLDKAIVLAHKESVAAMNQWKRDCLAHSKEFRANLAAEKAAAANAPQPPPSAVAGKAIAAAMRAEIAKGAKVRNAKIAERVTSLRATAEYAKADYHEVYRRALADVQDDETESFFGMGKAV